MGKNAGGVSYISLGDEIDFIMKPVLRGLCKYESMIDGTLSIYDVSLLNATIDVYDENQLRYSESQQ